ncbi:branched-chain amino acid ABC transporter permease [Methylobacterium soli]|uniref:Branched-chain amino acid ABC transporter permease n=1 Tax=Methylobacterium soli TaxID=553447 RepID=A0A6L3SYX3_9HYPH|nr:branched-chain amino acid ABC transporter permease [Methylobacterium soli]KAB1078505.1 branched-chain amino acid ABC transporter permease [Methylobacterium soli]GJE41991.1 High-affinity branched-chain amino acid transport system permease protein LivH [Methylobacterium soli]
MTYLFQILNGVGLGMLYFLLAVGLSIIFGLLQFVNFAHGAFYLLGAYLAYEMVERGASFWAALPLAALAVGLLAGLTEAVLLRRIYKQPHTFHILVTVGLALVVQEFVIIVWGPIGGNLPAPEALSGVVILGDFVYPEYRLFVIVFTAALAAALWWLLESTRLGAIVRAGSESPENMALLGYDTLRINTAVFALGAGLAGLAGALAAPIRGVEPFMGVEALSIAFVVVVIGGMGSYAGALAAGLVVGIAQSLMATLWPEGARLVIYLGMAGIIVAMPRGLFGRA